MTIDRTRCLFGGALLAAGLSATAQGQQFTFQSSVAYTGTQEFGYGYADFDNFGGPGPFSIVSYAASPYASAAGTMQADPSFVRGSFATTGFGGFAYGYDFVSYFTVDQNVLASASWDWTQGLGDLQIYEDAGNVLIFSDGGVPSGSGQVSLTADTQYFMTGFAGTIAEGDSAGYFELKVPSPGAAGLLGAAGLVAARRRRPTGLRAE